MSEGRKTRKVICNWCGKEVPRVEASYMGFGLWACESCEDKALTEIERLGEEDEWEED